MSLALDLLKEAQFLSRREAKRRVPRQAGLRRAVSTAYYAVFHLLAAEAATQACPPSPDGLKLRVQRALKHNVMKEAAKACLGKNRPTYLEEMAAPPLSEALVSVAKSFIRLQEFRHKADYDVSSEFESVPVQELVKEAEQLFRAWDSIRKTDEAHLFLASLLFWDRWTK